MSDKDMMIQEYFYFTFQYIDISFSVMILTFKQTKILQAVILLCNKF